MQLHNNYVVVADRIQVIPKLHCLSGFVSINNDHWHVLSISFILTTATLLVLAKFSIILINECRLNMTWSSYSQPEN